MTHFAQSDSHKWRGDSGDFVIQPCSTPLAKLEISAVQGHLNEQGETVVASIRGASHAH
jgi:hypothetical protein